MLFDYSNTYSISPLSAALDYMDNADEYGYPFFLDETGMPYEGEDYDPFFDTDY